MHPPAMLIPSLSLRNLFWTLLRPDALPMLLILPWLAKLVQFIQAWSYSFAHESYYSPSRALIAAWSIPSDLPWFQGGGFIWRNDVEDLKLGRPHPLLPDHINQFVLIIVHLPAWRLQFKSSSPTVSSMKKTTSHHHCYLAHY